jgi:hypothetical protein
MARIIFFLLLLVLVPSMLMAAPSASRTSGVAPLAVHFFADTAASTPTSQPFHDYEYVWDYGDSSSGNWATSGRSKNTDKGASAAHVYETPGTYTATLTVRDATSVVSSAIFTITVQDPNTVFSGTNTTCISTTSDFTGCPAGAAQVTTTNLGSTLPSYTAAGRRVLLRRGSSWSISSTISFPNNQGPVHIGAFGTCSSPDALGICSNAPSITVGSGYFINLDYKRDWRLADISFAGPAASSVTDGYMDMRNILLFRLNASGFDTGYGWSHWRTNDSQYIDGMAMVSSKSRSTRTYGAYVGSERLMYMGNDIQDIGQSHVTRIWHGHQAVVNHNILAGSSISNTAGRQALKLHGPRLQGTEGTSAAVGTFAQTGAAGLRNFTQFAVVSNNTIGSSGPWPVSIAPQNTVNGEAVSDILVEKNRVVNDYGTPSGFGPQDHGIRIAGRYYTVRNNIINGSGTAGTFAGIRALWNGVEPTPLGHRIYNNTIYHTGTVRNGARGVAIESVVANSIVRNNYVSFPNGTGGMSAVENASSTTTAGNNVLTSTPNFVDPNNPTPLSRSFALLATSTAAIDAGYAVPVYDDYDSASRRGGPIDLGAHEYNSGATVPVCSLLRLDLCTTESACNALFGSGDHWYGTPEICNADAYEESPVCGPTRRDLCTVDDCETTGEGHWWGGLCNAEAEVITTPRQFRQTATGTIRQTATGTVTQ